MKIIKISSESTDELFQLNQQLNYLQKQYDREKQVLDSKFQYQIENLKSSINNLIQQISLEDGQQEQELINNMRNNQQVPQNNQQVPQNNQQ